MARLVECMGSVNSPAHTQDWVDSNLYTFELFAHWVGNDQDCIRAAGVASCLNGNHGFKEVGRYKGYKGYKGKKGLSQDV
eukprot:1141752-Pelagomonas_calceolata.AAC.1